MSINDDKTKEIFINIGSLLKESRQQKKLSLDDVSNDLKIRKVQLESIESGNGKDTIQGEYFLYNFIKKYSQYLNIWDEISVILYDSNALSISNEINFERNNELKRYNKNKELAKKYFFWIKWITISLISLILIIGIVFWQNKSKEANTKKDLERIINTDKKLETPAYPKLENNTQQVITIPLEDNNTIINNEENNLKIQEELLKKDPNELTINIKYRSLLIVKDATGKEFIHEVVPGGSIYSFLGVPPYSVIIGWFTGSTIYKGKHRININSDIYPNNKPVEFTIN